MEVLKCSVEEILATHTEGQLYCMAVSSRIQYEAMKRRMAASERRRARTPASFEDAPGFVRPKKPLSKMTKLEQEAYYAAAGA